MRLYEVLQHAPHMGIADWRGSLKKGEIVNDRDLPPYVIDQLLSSELVKPAGEAPDPPATPPPPTPPLDPIDPNDVTGDVPVDEVGNADIAPPPDITTEDLDDDDDEEVDGEWAGFTNADLRDYAEQNGIELHGARTKAELIQAIQDHEAE
jgi:hypothetical protein